MQLRCWEPSIDGYPPRGSRRLSNNLWWLLSKTGAFARSGFAEICVEQDGRLLHRLIVTPAWFRFPFMSSRDLQIGDVWTAPDARRQGLGQAAIGEAHRRLSDDGACFWYVTDGDNGASGALARSCGYRLVAIGSRTRRFGTALLGQYVIEQFV
jgi:RimJ/RimL family protein N-acetyltransferase